MDDQARSIVSFRGNRENYRCGYCRSYGKVSDGMWAHKLTVQDYQDLIDRGWRRSGKYCYKPAMKKTCCPQYTIKCVANDFKLNKSHKKAIKRFNRYINADIPNMAEQRSQSNPEDLQDDVDISDVPQELMSREGQEELAVGEIDTSRLDGSSGAQSGTAGNKPPSSEDIAPSCSSKGSASARSGCLQDTREKKNITKNIPKPGVGADPSRPVCQKAKERRRERWRQKQGQLEREEPQAKASRPNGAKSLEQLLDEINSDSKHKLEVRLVRSSPRSEEFNATFEESYEVYKKYQMAIHGDPPEKPSQRQYTNFLVESPLQPYYREGGFPDGYGSFHQHYLIDNKIVAVGVLDILPNCVSSVYLYYDPDYPFLSLGTYSALRELAYVRHLHTMEPSIEYYYMGFYIHSCPKMRYKGQYVPSYLLCPETYRWIPIESCRPKLDQSKYARLENSPDAEDPQGKIELGQVLVLFARQAMPYQFYSLLNQESEDEEEVLQYAQFVGKECAERMLLYRS